MNRTGRGALAGTVGATVWTLSGPLLARIFGTRYSDVRLAGRLVTRGGLWPLAGIAVHTGLGTGLGVAFVRGGATSPGRALLASQVENVVAWPGMAVADALHPDRRDGYWPRLLADPRVFAQCAAARALFAISFAAAYARLG